MSIYAEEIVFRDRDGNEVVIPACEHAPGVKRECGPDGTIDHAMSANIDHRFALCVTILLRSDGSWVHWMTRDDARQNTYLHSDAYRNGTPATEAQRRTVARWLFKHEPRPYGLALGASVTEWAFAGLAPGEVESRYADGAKLYLTAPCDEREKIVR